MGREIPPTKRRCALAQRLDFIRALTIIPGERVPFRFRDLNTRAWLGFNSSVWTLHLQGLSRLGYFSRCHQQRRGALGRCGGSQQRFQRDRRDGGAGCDPAVPSAARHATSKRRRSTSLPSCATASAARVPRRSSLRPNPATLPPVTVPPSRASRSLIWRNSKRASSYTG